MATFQLFQNTKTLRHTFFGYFPKFLVQLFQCTLVKLSVMDFIEFLAVPEIDS